MTEQNLQQVLCIVQARLSSTRLPGKVLKEVGGVTLLEYEICRLRLAKTISKIIVATGDNRENDVIEALCKKIGIACFRGSEDDVLSRFARCAEAHPDYETIVRITGDCPLIDPRVVDRVVTFFREGAFEYASNVAPPTFPDGMDTEVFAKEALLQADREARLPSEREHVTVYLRNNPSFRQGNYSGRVDYSGFRLVVDHPEDFDVVRFLIEQSTPDDSFERYIELLKTHPEVMRKNVALVRNESLLKSLKEDYQVTKKK